jgi:arylsulfatase
MFGNRGIYHDGWFAGTIHRAPWEYVPRRPLKDDVWELYNVDADFSLANNLAEQEPERLKQMQDLFMQEAARNHVLPIDDRGVERFDAGLAGRPDLMNGRTELTVYPGMHGMMENAFINVKNRSHDITAELVVPPGGADGVILAQGGRFGGWSLYVKNNRPVYAYNYLGLEMFKVSSPTPLPSGTVTLKYVFVYDGGDPGSGGVERILVNGREVAQGRIGHTQASVFSSDDGADVGLDEGTPVSPDYPAWDNGYAGAIVRVTIKTQELELTPEQKKRLEELDRNAALGIE